MQCQLALRGTLAHVGPSKHGPGIRIARKRLPRRAVVADTITCSDYLLVLCGQNLHTSALKAGVRDYLGCTQTWPLYCLFCQSRTRGFSCLHPVFSRLVQATLDGTPMLRRRPATNIWGQLQQKLAFKLEFKCLIKAANIRQNRFQLCALKEMDRINYLNIEPDYLSAAWTSAKA